MDRQPRTKMNVPSYRFTDVEMATEGSLSAKLISQGKGGCSRNAWLWNARSWRKAVIKIARCWKCAGDLPDVSKCFRRPKHPCRRPPVTVHGVVFDILVGSPVWRQSVYVFAWLGLCRTPRLAPRSPHGCATRSPKGEAWWARQDSNLQPDRYERPALTIELQAPPGCRRGRHATVPPPLNPWPAIRQCRVPASGTLASARR